MSYSTIHTSLFAILLLAMPTGSAAADKVSAKLRGYEEVPALFSPGTGTFSATTTANSIAYTLKYNKLGHPVTQAHIHLGQAGVNGGVSVFLCTNLGNGPAGTPTCPGTLSGTRSGTISAANIVGPSAQNIGAGQIGRLLQAIKYGATYVNVHTTGFPNGEIRGKIWRVP